MKKLLIVLVLLLSVCLSFGQNLAKEIKQDWYTDLRDLEHILSDTITLYLYPTNHCMLPPHYRAWNFRRGMYARVDIETRKGIWDPLTIVEKWKVVKSSGEEYLIIKIVKNPVNKKRKGKAVFKIHPTYDNGKLTKILLVRNKGKYF